MFEESHYYQADHEWRHSSHHRKYEWNVRPLASVGSMSYTSQLDLSRKKKRNDYIKEDVIVEINQIGNREECETKNKEKKSTEK